MSSTNQKAMIRALNLDKINQRAGKCPTCGRRVLLPCLECEVAKQRRLARVVAEMRTE